MGLRRPETLCLGAVLVVGTLLRMWVWHDHSADPEDAYHRQPFQRITHPLKFEFGIRAAELAR
jgi:hypothetical protein